MTLAYTLNSAGVVAALVRTPQMSGVLVSATFADEQTPFFTPETFPVESGPGFSERAAAFTEARSREVRERHGISKAHIQVSDAGQIRLVVYAAGRADYATWFPFPNGPAPGSWF